jgi:O-methyltransferase involved in polyketide biosynthesis
LGIAGKKMIKHELTGISETLLIPLGMRATESMRAKSIIHDPVAIDIVNQINYDFSKFKSARLSQLGVSIRTMLLDRALTAFINSHPDTVVINLGAGLDTRHARLGLTDVIWYELDVPEAIEFRRQFFSPTDKYRFIAKSMFDYSWMDEIEDSGKSVIVIAEGLFMYFEEKELKTLIWRLIDRFPGAEMLLEVLGPFLVGKSKHHDSVSKIDNKPEFKWGLKKSEELTTWHPRIKLINEWCYFDYHKDRAGLIGYIVRLPFIRPQIASRIVHLKFS